MEESISEEIKQDLNVNLDQDSSKMNFTLQEEENNRDDKKSPLINDQLFDDKFDLIKEYIFLRLSWVGETTEKIEELRPEAFDKFSKIRFFFFIFFWILA